MQTIPIQPLPNQSVTALLNNQPCTINIRLMGASLFVDLYVNDALIIGGVIAQNANLIVRDVYLGFIGDVTFIDTQPTEDGPEDPSYTGLGSRWVLFYFAPADLLSAYAAHAVAVAA